MLKGTYPWPWPRCDTPLRAELGDLLYGQENCALEGELLLIDKDVKVAYEELLGCPGLCTLTGILVSSLESRLKPFTVVMLIPDHEGPVKLQCMPIQFPLDLCPLVQVHEGVRSYVGCIASK